MFKVIGSITITVLVIVTISTLIGIGSTMILGNGNIIERMAVDVIEHELGIDVHLTEAD